jgi:hypothetical protein
LFARALRGGTRTHRKVRALDLRVIASSVEGELGLGRCSAGSEARRFSGQAQVREDAAHDRARRDECDESALAVAVGQVSASMAITRWSNSAIATTTPGLALQPQAKPGVERARSLRATNRSRSRSRG